MTSERRLSSALLCSLHCHQVGVQPPAPEPPQTIKSPPSAVRVGVGVLLLLLLDLNLCSGDGLQLLQPRPGEGHLQHLLPPAKEGGRPGLWSCWRTRSLHRTFPEPDQWRVVFQK